MKTPNLIRVLKAFRRRRPFKPFLLELISGDRVMVGHPEILQFRGDLLVYQGPDGRHRVFECDAICQLLDVPPT